VIKLSWMDKIRARLQEYAEKDALSDEIKDFIDPIIKYGMGEEIRIEKDLKDNDSIVEELKAFERLHGIQKTKLLYSEEEFNMEEEKCQDREEKENQ